MKRHIQIATLFVVFCLCACMTISLEKKLPKEIRNWYDLHSVYMDTQVPKEIDAKKPTEKMYFLRMTDQQRRKYINLFWEIREIGAKEEFQLRYRIAQAVFKEGRQGWQTDRGWLMLLCGQPDYVEYRDENGQPYMEGNEEWTNLGEGERCFQIWRYWTPRGTDLIDFVFEWKITGTWELRPYYDGRLINFINYWKWRMAPVDEGWELWAKEMGK